MMRLYHGTTKDYSKPRLNGFGILWLAANPRVAFQYGNKSYSKSDVSYVWEIELKPRVKLAALTDLSNPAIRAAFDAQNEANRHGMGAWTEEDWRQHADFGILERWGWMVGLLKEKGLDGIMLRDTLSTTDIPHESVALFRIGAIARMERKALPRRDNETIGDIATDIGDWQENVEHTPNMADIYSYGRPKPAREKFTIERVSSPRPGSFLVEIDGGTSRLTVRVYDLDYERGPNVQPTAGWEMRGRDRPTEKEKAKIIQAVKRFARDAEHTPNMSDPTSPASRFADLQKQGFMRPRKAARKPKVEAPIVACSACLNWHREGKHTADAATRRANLAAEKARLASRAAREGHTPNAIVFAKDERLDEIDRLREVSRSRARGAESDAKAAQDLHDSWFGFTDTLSPTAKRRASDVLGKQVSVRGEFALRGDHIARLVKSGWVVQQGRRGRELVSPDGNFLSESDLTKLGLDFAIYLRHAHTPNSPSGNIPDEAESTRIDDLDAYCSTLLSHLHGDELDGAIGGEIKRRGVSDAEYRRRARENVHPDDLSAALVRGGVTLEKFGISGIRREQTPNARKRTSHYNLSNLDDDIDAALDHMSDYDSDLNRSNVAVTEPMMIRMQDLGQYDDLSSWLDLDSGADAQDIRSFRGSGWADRAEQWASPEQMPPIVIVEAPNMVAIADGRGRVNYATAMNWDEIPAVIVTPNETQQTPNARHGRYTPNAMTFEEAKRVRDQLDAEVRRYSDELNRFPKGPMGRTPDSVTATPEWRSAKSGFDRAFRALRSFNESFTKQFRKELAAERNELAAARMARHRKPDQTPNARKRTSRTREQSFSGYDFTTGDSGTTVHRETIDTSKRGDYGYDHVGDADEHGVFRSGLVRMIPSGDVVSLEEANRRLPPRRGGSGGSTIGFKLNGAGQTPNSFGHYVWVILPDGTPKEGPYGPYPLDEAEQMASGGAAEGTDDCAVSFGSLPSSSSFEIVRRYRRGTGESVS
jgi:hypothetical protein